MRETTGYPIIHQEVIYLTFAIERRIIFIMSAHVFIPLDFLVGVGGQAYSNTGRFLLYLTYQFDFI